MVSSTLCAPLADYMPGLRQAIIADLPRRRLGLGRQRDLAARLRAGHYGQALVMSRKWKAALAPWLAGIPVRTGFVGEARFGLINDMRWGERRLPRMIDQMGALALPRGAPLPAEWPLARAEGARRMKWRAGARPRGLAGVAGPIVMPLARRRRRRQGLAARPLRGAGQGAGAGRRLDLGAGRAERDRDRPRDRRRGRQAAYAT